MKAIVLAAGASRRAHGCKALFAHAEGGTFVDRAIATLRAAGASEVIVVVARPWRDAIAAHVARRGAARTVENEAPETGMLGSLSVGLSALAARDGPVVVSLVDHPSVQASTVRRLVEAARPFGPDVIARPRWRDRHGHPVVLGPEAVARLADPSRARAGTMRDALSSGGRLVSIDVEDPAILEDRDQPASLAVSEPSA